MTDPAKLHEMSHLIARCESRVHAVREQLELAQLRAGTPTAGSVALSHELVSLAVDLAALRTRVAFFDRPTTPIDPSLRPVDTRPSPLL